MAAEKNAQKHEVTVRTRGEILRAVRSSQLKSHIPSFRPGDTVRVHCRIVEGNKERIQIFEGVVIKRHNGNHLDATFTVRKVSYNIGVERTFLLHSPRVEKVEVMATGSVRRARLFYLRNLRGKAARIKSEIVTQEQRDRIEAERLAEERNAAAETEAAPQEAAQQ